MAVNPNNLLGQSNPNGTVGVSLGIDPAGANEAFSAGATSGFYVTPTSPAGMSVEVGGAVGVVDSALVRSASGITFPVGNVTGTPITLTVPAAPSTNSRIDSVVLYVDTSVTATATDGANAVGMEIVSGTSASNPVPPTDQQIRSAIQDGASIAYTVLANITVSSSTSTITASNISQANRAQITADKIDFATTAGTVSTVRAGINNSFVRVNPSGVGVLGIVYRPNTNIPTSQDITILKSDILPDVQYALNTILQGVTSGNQMGILNFRSNGNIDFYNNNSGGYGNWIRAVIPFIADV